MAYYPTKPKSTGASGKYYTHLPGESGTITTAEGTTIKVTANPQSSYPEVRQARQEAIQQQDLNEGTLTAQQQKELESSQITTTTIPPNTNQQLHNQQFIQANLQTKKNPQEVKVAVSKKQVQEINTTISSEELKKALIEGRIIPTPEGFEVIKETIPTTSPPIESKKFTTPRTINPQETQPVTKEINYPNLLPITHYGGVMNAIPPTPKQEMQDITPLMSKVNKAFEQGVSDFLQYAETPGNEPLILLSVPIKYYYGRIIEARNIGQSAGEIGLKALGGENVLSLAGETVYGMFEAVQQQEERIVGAVATGNIPALSEEAGRIRTLYQLQKGEISITNPIKLWYENINLAEAQLKYNLETYGTTVKPKEITPPKTDLETIKRIQSEVPNTEISIPVTEIESIQGTKAELGTKTGTTSKGIISVNYKEPQIIPVNELPPPADFYEIKYGSARSSTDNIRLPRIKEETNALTTTTERTPIRPGEIIITGGERAVSFPKEKTAPIITDTGILRIKANEFEKVIQELPERKVAVMEETDFYPNPRHKAVEVFTAQVRGINYPEEIITLYWQQLEYSWKEQKGSEWNRAGIEDLRFRLETTGRKTLEGTGYDLGVRPSKGGYEIDFYQTLPSGKRTYVGTIFKPFPKEETIIQPTKIEEKPSTKKSIIENINPETGTETILEKTEVKTKTKKKIKIEPPETQTRTPELPPPTPPPEGQTGFFEAPENYGNPVYIIQPRTEPIIKTREPTTILNPPSHSFIIINPGKTITKEPTNKEPTKTATNIPPGITQIAPKTEIKSIPKVEMRIESKPEVRTGNKIMGRTRAKIKTGTSIIQAQAQAQIQIQEQIQEQQETIQTTTILKKTVPEEKPREPFPRMGKEEKKKLGTPITIKVRKKGIFQEAGTEENIPKALSKAESIIKNTASASFKLEQQGAIITNLMPSKEFRKSKKEKGVMIQKREYRISTPGEKTEITQKGILASKIKNKRRKGLWGF